MKKKFDYKLFLIFSGMLCLAVFMFGYGNDYFWHVKAGEYIVTNLKIPYYDIFSWYGISNNLYWFSHEWLSEVVLYLYQVVFRGLGPFIYCVTTYLILIFILYHMNRDKMQRNLFFTFFWSVIGFLTFSRVMLARPHMLSFILLAFTIYLLYDNFNHKDSKKIYFLPIISILWGNFHGGSSNLPYLLCFVFLFVSMLQFQFCKIFAHKTSRAQQKRFLIVGIICFFSLILNPHGVKLLSYPYINMGDTLMLNTITEWASPSLNHISDYTDFLLLGVVILTMIITRRKIKLIDLIMLGFFLVLGFKSVRFIPLLYITATFIIFDLIDNVVFEIHRYVMPIFLLMLVVIALGLSTRLVRVYQEQKIPTEVIDYIKEQDPKRLYNFYDLGGYLIYRDIKVFIDGRADMYSKYNLADAVDIQNHGYQYLLERYDFDMFVITNTIPINIYLSNHPDYYMSMQQGKIVIYEKLVHE